MTDATELSPRFQQTELSNNILPLVREAGFLALKLQQDMLSIETKADGSPVTHADRAVEALLYDRLEELYPEDGFRGEEESFRESKSGREWIVDPIDGTVQFIRGQEFWSILLALDDKSVGKLGVVAFPAREETIFAESGRGCWEMNRNGTRKLEVSQVNTIDEAYILHNGLDFARRTNRVERLSSMLSRAHAERGYADAFGHMEIVRGRSDIMVDFLTEYHDIAAVRVAATEAGGAWSSLDGGHDLSCGGSITSNGVLHPIAVSYLRNPDESHGEA